MGGTAVTKLIAFSMVVALGPICAQETVVSPRPLGTVADRLQESWARPVTYEDPVWLWSGDLETDKPGVKWSTYPKRRVMQIPTAAVKNLDRKRDSALLTQIVEAWNRSAGGPKFAVRTSSFGIHIVPVASADASGRMRPAAPLLDQVVTVPAEFRLPNEHLRALAWALKASTGMWIYESIGSIGVRFNQVFTGTGNLMFEWGVEQRQAREALIDLLTRSATTFSWRFNCQPAESVQDRFCVLNIVPIMVQRTNSAGEVIRDMIAYDRCKRCPTRPPLPPPRKKPR
jgi:hypothetical protein